MSKEIDFWQFVYSRLKNKNERVIILVVAQSAGSSPGRAGYKMAVAADGEIVGSIGGGVMEVELVERARAILSEPPAVAGSFTPQVIEQVHQKNSPNASGMICSGRQTVLVKELTANDIDTVTQVINCLSSGMAGSIEITYTSFLLIENTQDNAHSYFIRKSETEFIYQERLGYRHHLYIIGGGHCALALSELMSKLGFSITLFDDRPELNTLKKNHFAHAINIIGSYENIADLIESGEENYVAVMTIGYKFDEIVIRRLFNKDFRYFGVLGSKAKMKTLLTTLEKDGFDKERLAKIRTPIGLPINSRTPEEIAVSIAAEILSVKNA